jgi:hypothetical protein
MRHGGRIAILPGQSKAETFATLVDELAKELLMHTSRCTTTRTVREAEAEAISVLSFSEVSLQAFMHYFSVLPMEGYFFFTACLTLVFSAGAPNCETRDKAFLACASFSIGYLRLSGSAKDLAGNSFRAVVESFAICDLISGLKIGIDIPVITPIAAGLPDYPTPNGSSNLGTRP